MPWHDEAYVAKFGNMSYASTNAYIRRNQEENESCNLYDG